MKYVIIGGSAAGISCIEAIREKDKKSIIMLISDEEFPLYSRCLLTYLLAGTIKENGLLFKEKDFYEKNNVEAIHGVMAKSIDVKKKSVKLADGKNIQFDKLLIATGARPKKISAPGVDKKGVFTLRYIEDARGIEKLLDKVKNVVILGGGLIGLRDAYALRQRGKEINVIVKSPFILSQMVDKGAADIIADALKSHGINIMTGVDAKEIKGNGEVKAILLDNGQLLDCELIIIGKGVSPNTEIAKEAGINVNAGIEVDGYLMTSEKDIYAAGDAAETIDMAEGVKRVNALWPIAAEQGRLAGLNMAGEKRKYDGSISMNSIDFFGLASISMGITKPEDKTFEILEKSGKSLYKKVVIKNNVIKGAVLVGSVNNAGIINVLLRKGIDVSSIKHKLLDDDLNYAAILPLVSKYADKFNEEEFKDTVITY